MHRRLSPLPPQPGDNCRHVVRPPASSCRLEDPSRQVGKAAEHRAHHKALEPVEAQRRPSTVRQKLHDVANAQEALDRKRLDSAGTEAVLGCAVAEDAERASRFQK